MSIDQGRRGLLSGLGAIPFLQVLPGLALAGSNAATRQRFILVILRGAMDGIAAVTPYGDPALAGLRDNLLVPEQSLLKLDSYFGMHPAFGNIYKAYVAGELEVCHAVATPYRSRSHFDAQHVLETGYGEVLPTASGWLNRCAGYLDGNGPGALAVGQVLPKVLQGETEVASWTPDNLPGLEDATLERLKRLYESDVYLSGRLQLGLQTDAMVPESGMAGGLRANRNLVMLAQAAGNFLASETGPVIAVLEAQGWDTHANQGAMQGLLAQRFSELDSAVATLQVSLRDYWPTTQVLVVTEFGRTAAANGTGGTDHGTASVAFRLGGQVNGGRVLTAWPGLAAGNLYEGRDLQPTMDMRELFRDAVRHILGSVPDGIV